MKMDEKIAKWILEYLLRNPSIDEKIINGVLSCLPLSNNDNRLKKTILLRKIQSEISTASFSEKLLEFLEIIEEIDHSEGKTASDLMKEAYCTVAVDCTVRYLDENVRENVKYFEAVERVWRNRVCRMEELGSDESNRWWGDIEAAVWDSSVCEKILMRNTRNDAMKAIKRYLEEGWQSLGPTFLELMALKAGNEVEALPLGGDGGGGHVDASDNPCREVVSSQGIQKGQAIIRRKHIAVKTKLPRGAKISDADEEDETTKTANDVVIHKIDKVQKTANFACDSHSHPDASQAAHNFPCTTRNDDNNVRVHNTENVQEALQTCSTHDSHPGAFQAAHILSFTKMIGNSNKVSAAESQIRPVLHASPEVAGVQEALKSSVRELKAAVTDPLPEALRTVENLCSTRVNVENHTGAETRVAPEVGSVQQTLVTNSVESTENNPEKVKKKDNLIGDAQVHETCDAENNLENVMKNETHDRKEQPNRKRSLMDPNGTGHTFEWDDSIENSSESGHVTLPPSSKRSRIVPLQPYVEKKISRERKKWTPREEETLRDAVKKFGRRWKFILEGYCDVFRNRTDVDLKDKWRNMLKYPAS